MNKIYGIMQLSTISKLKKGIGHLAQCRATLVSSKPHITQNAIINKEEFT